MPPPRRRAPATRRNAPPAPKRNLRALKTGAQANGENLPNYEKTRAEVEAVRAEAPWILRTDEPLLEVFAAELNAYRYTNVALDRLAADATGDIVNQALGEEHEDLNQPSEGSLTSLQNSIDAALTAGRALIAEVETKA